MAHFEISGIGKGSSLNQLYGVDRVWVDSFTLAFLASPVLFSLVAGYLISAHSLTLSMTLGVLLSCGGAWLRTFINDNFSVALAGQCVASIGASFFLAAPSFFSARWFFPSNVSLLPALASHSHSPAHTHSFSLRLSFAHHHHYRSLRLSFFSK